MATVNKRTTESKYVTVFADARADVDMTFRDVLLSRPTNHYLVGVDNLTLCSSNLSMVEPRTGDQKPLLRIVRKILADKLNLEAADNIETLISNQNTPLRATLDEGVTDRDFEVSSEMVFLTVQQLMHRLNMVAGAVNTTMNSGAVLPVTHGQTGDLEHFGYTPVPNDSHKHLQFDVRGDGRLVIEGSKAFWTVFCIEVPTVQYQYGFWGEPRAEIKQPDGTVSFRGDPAYRRYLVVDPETGNYSFDPKQVLYPTPYSVAHLLDLSERIAQAYANIHEGLDIAVGDPIPNTVPQQYYDGAGAAQAMLLYVQEQTALHGQLVAQLLAQRIINGHAIGGANPRLFVYGTYGQGGGVLDSGNAQARLNRCNGAQAVSREMINLALDANIFSTMERRVAVELGCSLPIKNSPMIDHQKETPDFVLGRWIIKPDTRMGSNESGGSRRYESLLPSTVEYQKAMDRVVFHELQPQQKIQVLRLRLFARVRAFDEATEVWSMRVIEMPTASTDWWHCRLHFVSKD